MSDTNPAQAEAEGVQMATVEWRDLAPFEVPVYRNDWPFEAALAVEQAQDATLLAQLLPVEAYQQFLAMRPTMADAKDLSNAIARALGMAHPGESPASSS